MRSDDNCMMRVVLDYFVRYLNVVEPCHPPHGSLDCRISFATDDYGALRFCVQDRVVCGTVDDRRRFDCIFERIERFVRSLNAVGLFANADIYYVCDLYDVEAGLRYEEVCRHDR